MKIHQIKIILIIFLLFSFSAVYASPAITIYITDFNVYSDFHKVEVNEKESDFTNQFSKKVSEYDVEDSIKLSQIDSEEIVKTTLNASEFIFQHHMKFLIYGFIKKTEKFYDCELRLFEKESRDNVKVIYAKFAIEEYDLMVKFLAKSFTEYIYSIYGYEKKAFNLYPEIGGIGLSSSVGYWTVLGNNWGSVMTGIFSVQLGCFIMPKKDIPFRKKYSIDFRFGGFLQYSFGINDSEIQSFYLHSFGIRFPAQFLLRIRENQQFVFGAGLIMEIDYIKQNLMYSEPSSEVTVAAGINFNTGYEFWINKNLSHAFGLSCDIDLLFYNPIMPEFRANFYYIYKFPSREEKKNE